MESDPSMIWINKAMELEQELELNMVRNELKSDSGAGSRAGIVTALVHRYCKQTVHIGHKQSWER